MNETLTLLWQAILPYLVEIIGVIVLAVIGWAADTLRQYTRIEIEAKHRAALHMALMSGLKAALMRGDKNPVESALEHATRSTPDPIRALKGHPGTLRGIAQGMLPTVVAEAGNTLP